MPDDDDESQRRSNDVTSSDIGRKDIEKLLDSLPNELLVESLERRGDMSGIRASYSWQAPLPPAQMLRQYDDISPGFADRIISSSEREQSHRHNCEKSALGASIGAERRGQWMALAIAVVMIVTSAALIWKGHSIAASIFGGVTLLGLVALFQDKQWRFWRKEAEQSEEDDD